MRRLVTFVLVACALAGAGLLSSAPASACSCIGMSDEEAFESADVVFIGTLDEPQNGGAAVWRFRVDQVLKGAARDVQDVGTHESGATCGLELQGRGPFLVFAKHNRPVMFADAGPGALYASLCGGSRSLDEAPVPAAFEGGDGVLVDAPSESESGAWPPSVAAIAAAGALAALVAVMLVTMRRDRPSRDA